MGVRDKPRNLTSTACFFPQMGLKVMAGIGDQCAAQKWLFFDGFDGFLDGRNSSILSVGRCLFEVSSGGEL
jgi:hypothetical protein